jgi:hypothetical protein
MNAGFPSDFDWVTARHQCSVAKMFEALHLEAKANVETMNRLAPERPWNFVDAGGGFSVSRRTEFGQRGVRFTVNDQSAVVVTGHNAPVNFTASITLNDDGECRFLVDGQELDRWQVLRRALEPLLFSPDPFSRAVDGFSCATVRVGGTGTACDHNRRHFAMSDSLQEVRERWRSREMVLVRWFKLPGEQFRPREPICVVRVDGVERVVTYEGDEPVCGIYWHYVEPGEEVGPWGQLLEYSDGGYLLAHPEQARHHWARRRFAYRRREQYPRVFLSYRREDAEAHAGRLHEVLVRTFGADDVFMDQFSIRPGEPFPWAIQQAAAHCSVMVCVIGPKWLTAVDRWNRRRLDFIFDYVRREVTSALDRRIGLIPVLLPGASVPEMSVLPEEMRGLELLQMLELSARHWDADMAELLNGIRAELGEG